MRSLRVSFASLVLATACGATEDLKEDAAEAPFAAEALGAEGAEGKADSAARPIDRGVLKVGRSGEGEFTAREGWFSYELALTSGQVDVMAWGEQADGSTQDTIVYVFGPQRDNGNFPSRALAFNDDEAQGTYSSRVTASIPRDGVYRVVVSTYDNWRRFPRNVSRGTFGVIVKCPRAAGAESCGPAALFEGGACWNDIDCVNGLRCQDEIVCPPNVVCIWARAGQCVVDDAWLTYAPKQCGQNPWQQNATGAASHLGGELGDVHGFFAGKNITLKNLGFLAPAEPKFQCQACSCARGDTLLVHAGPFDAARLEQEFGFRCVTDGSLAAVAPVQCGGNPWDEDGDKLVEAENFVSWATDQGATPLSVVGFVFPGEQRFQCAACSCSRGDLLVAGGATEEASHRLNDLGLEPLHRP